jgi:hypothetical protein
MAAQSRGRAAAAQAEFMREKLAGEHLFPLLWLTQL